MGIKVLVADGQPLLTECLTGVLARYDDLLPIPIEGPFRYFVVEDARRHQPDVALVDYWMSGIEGPAGCAEVLAHLEGVKVILLSWFYANRPWFDPPGDIERALAAGAVGFIPKNCDVDTVAEAVRRAYKGERPVMAEDLEELIERMRRRRERAGQLWRQMASLTPREVQILELLAMGTSVPDGADALCISQATLRTHIQRILHKTGTHSQVAAVAAARNYGVITV